MTLPALNPDAAIATKESFDDNENIEAN